jgi:hypothetical protein
VLTPLASPRLASLCVGRDRSKRAKNVKDIAVGKKFIEEEHDHRSGKKKQRRMMPGGLIDIS